MNNNLINNIMPEEIETWYFIENSIKRIMNLYNFKEFRPSILQLNSLYKKYFDFSQELDDKNIQNKILHIKDLDEYGLRPEGTLAVLNSELAQNAITKSQKIFYTGPMFVKNNDNYLQYHQIGAEILGSDNVISDIEIVQLAKTIFKELGINDLFLEINSFGCEKCRPKYLNALKQFIHLNRNEVCDHCKKHLDQEPLVILNCLNQSCKQISNMAPINLDYLCNDCLENFTKIKKLLSNIGTNFTVNPNLSLNFNYYSRLVFNLTTNINSQNQTNNSIKQNQKIIATGGRYNQLAKYTTQLPLAAVGFSFNIESVIEIIKQKNPKSKKPRLFSVCVCSVADSMELLILQVTQELHSYDIHTIIIENKIDIDQVNQLSKLHECNIILVFREDLIRDAKLMVLTYNHNQEKTNQDIILLSDLMDDILRKKKSISY